MWSALSSSNIKIFYLQCITLIVVFPNKNKTDGSKQLDLQIYILPHYKKRRVTPHQMIMSALQCKRKFFVLRKVHQKKFDVHHMDTSIGYHIDTETRNLQRLPKWIQWLNNISYMFIYVLMIFYKSQSKSWWWNFEISWKGKGA